MLAKCSFLWQFSLHFFLYEFSYHRIQARNIIATNFFFSSGYGGGYSSSNYDDYSGNSYSSGPNYSSGGYDNYKSSK